MSNLLVIGLQLNSSSLLFRIGKKVTLFSMLPTVFPQVIVAMFSHLAPVL